MGRHTLADYALQSGKTDAVLVLKQLADTADAAVAEMVDVIIGADPVFNVHVVVDGGKNILFGHVLGHEFMHTSPKTLSSLSIRKVPSP